MTRGQLLLYWRDFSAERGKLTLTLPVRTAANWDDQQALQDALIAAIQAVCLGTLYQRDYRIIGDYPRVRPIFKSAQRKTTWRVAYTDDVTKRPGRVDIPAANLYFLVADGAEMDLAVDPGAALVTAFEAYARSKDGNPVTIHSIRHVGRRYGEGADDMEPDTSETALTWQYAEFSGEGTLQGYAIEPVNNPGNQFYGSGLDTHVRSGGFLHTSSSILYLNTAIDAAIYELRLSRGSGAYTMYFRSTGGNQFFYLSILSDRARISRYDGPGQSFVMLTIYGTIPADEQREYQVINAPGELLLACDLGQGAVSTAQYFGGTLTHFKDSVGAALWDYFKVRKL
jgi:hypothetical protein